MGFFQQFDAPIEAKLRWRVNGGFIIAVLLTAFLGFSSWRNARLTAEDASWVAHTYIVIDMIELVSKHVIEVETSSRTFALTGQELLFAHYEAAQGTVAQDEDALRYLTSDNPHQQRRLDVLEPQIRTALEFAGSMVAKRRQSEAVPDAGEILKTEKLMDAVRATGQEMHAEEMQLLTERARRTEAGRQVTSLIIVVGIFVGAGLLALARLAVNREIEVGAQAREQIGTLNAGLEQRVEERTAALESEIIERKQTEQALAEQAEELTRSRLAVEAQTLMLQSVLDSMAEGLVAADEQGKFLIWNRAAERILGHGPADLPPKEWSE